MSQQKTIKPLTVNQVRISLVFNRYFLFTKRFLTWEVYEEWNDTLRKELDLATAAGMYYIKWKSAFTVTFPFSETDRAETLASAVIHHHAAKPTVLIDHVSKIITVRSPGYQA